MRSLLGIAIALWFLIVLASAVQAGSVYLKDGGIVECESFWRKGDQVIVKVNRDVVVEFGSDEIDLKKTVRGAKPKSGRHLQAKTKAARHVVYPTVTATPGAGEMAGKPSADGQGGTKVEFMYAAAGYHPQGMATLAPLVDSVLMDAVARLRSYLDTGNPAPAKE